MILKKASLYFLGQLFIGFVLLTGFWLPGHAAGFETVVVGQVVNKADKSPLPGVNVVFKNSATGVQTNEEGYFLIRTRENYSVLVFSSVGYKKKEIRVKPGQSVGTQVELDEENTLLQEVFVLPGINPALELMKKVRLLKKDNDVYRLPGFSARSKEQDLVMLSKLTRHSINKRIFDQLRNTSLNSHDSSLLVPLYMSEKTFRISSSEKKEVSRKMFHSPVNFQNLIENLLGEINNNLNFYDNVVLIFGKGMVSPLANVGNSYYTYFLADSLQAEKGKQYVIHFHARDPRSLAFNGKFTIDSATYALTGIEADLSPLANINFVRNLHISQQFEKAGKHWFRKSEELTLSMDYALLADSINPRPEIFIKQTADYRHTDSVADLKGSFAHTNYSDSILDARLDELTNTPLLRTAKWLADVVFTGYVPFGKIDLGKIQQVMRISDIEGFRATLPFRTNERLWKNLSLGGYLGYGFKNETFKYSAFAQYKLPGSIRRVFSLGYTDDYRRVNYDYDDFMYRENPLVTGDVDISNTLFSLSSASNMNERHELSFSFANDWNDDIESTLYLRSNSLYGNSSLPLLRNGNTVATALEYQFATLTTRFSFDERTYEDHTQRIYIDNKKPRIYSIMEIGKYRQGAVSGTYGKLVGKMKHSFIFGLAELNYTAEAGLILGKVPYPLLQTPVNGGGYSLYYFGMMNFMEYAADKYLSVHSDMTFNGIILNQVPLIKKLKLRELCSFNCMYGSLKPMHRSVLDLPQGMYPLSKPYMEVGVGFSNILHIFTLQSVWRLTDLDHSGVLPWALRGSLRISL